MLTIIAMAVAVPAGITLVIFVHELGHYLTAKRLGIMNENERVAHTGPRLVK